MSELSFSRSGRGSEEAAAMNKPIANPARDQSRRPIGEVIRDREIMREALRRAAEVAERRKALRPQPSSKAEH